MDDEKFNHYLVSFCKTTVKVVNKGKRDDYYPMVATFLPDGEAVMDTLVEQEGGSDRREGPVDVVELIRALGRKLARGGKLPVLVFVLIRLAADRIEIHGCTEDGRTNSARFPVSTDKKGHLRVGKPEMTPYQSRKTRDRGATGLAEAFYEGFRSGLKARKR